MLYGVTELDFGAGTNICFLEDDAYEKFDALPEQYTKSGYRAEMLHGYNDSLYNRTVTYPRLGFSDLLFSADIQALDFPWEGGIYGGYYMRDSYFFQAMLDRMEDINSSGERAFLYGITMGEPPALLTRRNSTMSVRSASPAKASARRIWPSSGSCWRASPGRIRPWEI